MLKPQRIFFRVDGGPKIGYGHFVRCVSLAKIIKRNYEIYFSCVEITYTMQKELSNMNFTLFKLNTEEEFLNSVSDDDVVIVDNYGVNSDYLRNLKSKVSKLISIDDLHDKYFYSDLIINHAPGITIEDYQYSNETKLALGPKFALLRASFIKAAINTREINSLENVLICFGGSDEHNFTYKAAEVIAKSKTFKSINIVVGGSYQFNKQIEEFSKQNSNIFVHYNLNENEMCSLMLNSDLAIVPASSVLLESIACGMLCIVCAFVDNQKLLHDFIVDKLNVPSFSDDLIPNFEKLKSIIENKKLIFNQNTQCIKTDISSACENLLQIIREIIN